jgi:phosphoglycolate phosphatase-like HAD superfamily hydrolase
VVVIGDTPHDVACAAVAGARSIGVATGGHTREELVRAGADVALDDLSDTDRVLSLIVSP